jgi:hypothetical protein
MPTIPVLLEIPSFTSLVPMLSNRVGKPQLVGFEHEYNASTLRVAGKPKGLAAFAPTLQQVVEPLQHVTDEDVPATSGTGAHVGKAEHPLG